MAMTPVEVRHLSFSRRPLGYSRESVDSTLEQVAQSFEDVWRERCDLADRVDQLETEIARYRDLESLLRTTLVSAERTAHELKAQAKREAELVLNEAHAEARSITLRARAERERLVLEARRVRTLLRGALENVEEAPALEALDAPETDGEDNGATAQREAA
jgi:cell division initiation protein